MDKWTYIEESDAHEPQRIQYDNEGQQAIACNLSGIHIKSFSV